MVEDLLEFLCRFMPAMGGKVGLAPQVSCQKGVRPTGLVEGCQCEELHRPHRIASLELDCGLNLRHPHPAAETARWCLGCETVPCLRGRKRVAGECEGHRRFSSELERRSGVAARAVPIVTQCRLQSFVGFRVSRSCRVSLS